MSSWARLWTTHSTSCKFFLKNRWRIVEFEFERVPYPCTVRHSYLRIRIMIWIGKRRVLAKNHIPKIEQWLELGSEIRLGQQWGVFGFWRQSWLGAEFYISVNELKFVAKIPSPCLWGIFKGPRKYTYLVGRIEQNARLGKRRRNRYKPVNDAWSRSNCMLTIATRT